MSLVYPQLCTPTAHHYQTLFVALRGSRGTQNTNGGRHTTEGGVNPTAHHVIMDMHPGCELTIPQLLRALEGKLHRLM